MSDAQGCSDFPGFNKLADEALTSGGVDVGKEAIERYTGVDGR
jgi:hypothetical protein